LISILVHFMIGSAGGVLLAYYMKFAGKDFYWLKGLALATFMLVTGMGFTTHILNILPEIHKYILTVYAYHNLNSLWSGGRLYNC